MSQNRRRVSRETLRDPASKPADEIAVEAAPTTDEVMSAAAPKSPAAARGPASSLWIPAVAILVMSLVIGAVASQRLVLLACLLAIGCYVLGLETVGRFMSDWPASATRWHIALTDAQLSLGTLNKFANSCQCREKGLKIVQYVLRAGAFSALFSKDVAATLKSLSKTTSIARRFFKFCRWIKHFEDLKEAKDETSSFMRTLLYVRIAANLGADWAEDVCSLERIGFLPKGTLSVEFMLFAEYCQLVLALVEIGVTSARARAEQWKADTIEADRTAKPGDLLKQQRKLTLMRLELVKFVSDIGKAAYDCELHFADEGIFIGCSLFSALLSTHKNMVKVLK